MEASDNDGTSEEEEENSDESEEDVKPKISKAKTPAKRGRPRRVIEETAARSDENDYVIGTLYSDSIYFTTHYFSGSGRPICRFIRQYSSYG